MQRINQSIIESRLMHSLGLSQSRSAHNTFFSSYLERDDTDPYDPTLPSDHIIWSRGDFPILSRTYQKKALHTFEICWKYQGMRANRIANILLKNCLREWNQRLILDSRWVEGFLEKNTSVHSGRTQIFADITYSHGNTHLTFFSHGGKIVIPNEWFFSPKIPSTFSRIRTFFSR